jgi:ferredoxin-NADP reductase
MGKAFLEKRKTLVNDVEILTFFLPKGEALGFLGGQYIIVNSGLENGEGKTFKRAYSILSSDKNQDRFEIAYKKIPKGILGNRYFPKLKIGDEMTFSGPWGKFLKNEHWPRKGKIAIFSTDTGISAALSFMQGQKLAQRKKDLYSLWLSPGSNYFLKEDSVDKILKQNCNFHEIKRISESPAMARLDQGIKEGLHFFDFIGNDLNNAFLAGDGKIILKLKEILIEKGLEEENIGMEVFFNKEKN